jgi:hypothetical protein
MYLNDIPVRKLNDDYERQSQRQTRDDTQRPGYAIGIVSRSSKFKALVSSSKSEWYICSQG